jgi:predicted nucleic acid-binding protein
VIVLDTNVMSEMMRPMRDIAVQHWTRAQKAEERFTTAITLSEIRYGTERLPESCRKAALRSISDEVFAAFRGQILSFDAAAAEQYAAVVVARDAAGSPISAFDAQIAAICRAHGAVLATRNVKDFEGLGIKLVDPWSV